MNSCPGVLLNQIVSLGNINHMPNWKTTRGTVSTVTHPGNKEPRLHSSGQYISFPSHPHQPRSDARRPSSCSGQLQSVPVPIHGTLRLPSKMQVWGCAWSRGPAELAPQFTTYPRGTWGHCVEGHRACALPMNKHPTCEKYRIKNKYVK